VEAIIAVDSDRATMEPPWRQSSPSTATDVREENPR
jgi:hypothetical protein